MKRAAAILIGLLLLSLGFLVSVRADSPNASVTVTARGGAYYRVLIDGDEVSKHSTQHKAHERAANEALANPDASVEVRYEVRYEFTAAKPAPDPEPEPDPDPEPEPTPQAFSPANLKLVGGYRVGWYNTYLNKLVAKSTGHPYGGMAAHTFDDGTLIVWHENGEQGRQVIESSTTKPMGTGADPTKWPLLDEADSHAKVWSKAELYGDRAASQFVTPYGLAFDPEGQRLWVSARSTYATGPDSQQWLAAVDYPSREVNAVQPRMTIPQAKYGGGLGIIPKAFADAHLGGRRLGFISGGYESGQGASMGPTLAATYLEPGRQGDAVQLMHYRTTGELTQANFEQYRDQVAQTFPDYTSDMSWNWNPVDGIGWWNNGSIRGNGAWLPGGPVLWMVARGVGVQTYAAQVEGGGAPLENNLYVYQPEAFTGDQKPLGISREFYEFYRWDATNNGGINAIARALSYDSGSGLLWVYYPRVWRGDVERHPIVAAYEIITPEGQ